MPTRDEYQWLKEMGRCTHCQVRDAKPGRVLCQRCRDLQIQRTRRNIAADPELQRLRDTDCRQRRQLRQWAFRNKLPPLCPGERT